MERSGVTKWFAAGLVVGSLVWASMAQAAGWEPVKQGQGRTEVSTYEKDVDDSPVKAFRGVTEVKAPVLSVLAVLADAQACAEWLYQCQSLELRDNDQAYIRFKGIWPAKDRDALIQTQTTQNADGGAITIASRKVDGEPQHDGYVRVAALRDRFVLTPLDDGWTRIEFETLIDPGGNVLSVANVISNQAPKETLQGLRKLAGSDAYQGAKLDQALVRYPALKGMVLPESHQPD